MVKNLPTNAGDVVRSLVRKDSLGEGNGNPLQYSCLGNPMDRGAWWATVHGVVKSQTRLSDWITTFIHLFGCAGPCLQHARSFFFFSCSMQPLSCGMWHLVPSPGIEHMHWECGVLAAEHQGSPFPGDLNVHLSWKLLNEIHASQSVLPGPTVASPRNLWEVQILRPPNCWIKNSKWPRQHLRFVCFNLFYLFGCSGSSLLCVGFL